MDKIKEKLEKLRIEADEAKSRAAKHESDVRELQQALSQREVEVQGLNNRLRLVEEANERNEKRVADLTEKNRSLELTSEQAERRASQLEAERTALEAQVADITAKHAAVKEELRATLAELEGM
ncbi:hypothetical protein HDU86_004097 [Geranomyces michiganensis]|nr:hypothetical protein HDU86_004097 [Geranomyces michiganensis]